MLKYKIATTDINANRTGEYAYMINRVTEDYTQYYSASEYLQKRYDFCMQAIYSCLSKANNSVNRKNAYIELSKFLGVIKKISGLDMQIVSKDKFYVKERQKVKALPWFRLH